jgi:endonuclease YncB( thermonuclease family)
MKKLFYILSILFFSNTCLANEVNIIKVIDGDTFEIEGTYIFNKVLPLKVRVRGIDTPEIKGKCQKERDLAIKAKNFTEQFLKNKNVVIDNIDWDKYGGRILAEVEVDNINLAQTLIKQKLAVEYYGKGKKFNWCK